MSILIGEATRVLVQGITGNEGRFHTQQMFEYGTNVVAGVTPGKGGQDVEGVPVFDTVSEGVDAGRPVGVERLFTQRRQTPFVLPQIRQTTQRQSSHLMAPMRDLLLQGQANRSNQANMLL